MTTTAPTPQQSPTTIPLADPLAQSAPPVVSTPVVAVPAQPPPAQPVAAPPAPGTESTPITMSSEQLKERLDRARAQAHEELLKSLGIKSTDEAKTKLQQMQDNEKKSELERLSKLSEQQRLEEQLAKERSQREDFERKWKEAQAAATEREMQLELQQAALAAGVRPEELDYALYQYRATVKQLGVDQLASMGTPLTWFRGALRQRKPHIFADAATIVPPASYQVPGAAPAAVTTGAPPQVPPQEGSPAQAPKVKSAFDMTAEEWNAHKARVGL